VKISQEIAKAAAEWWASKIDGHQYHDNGDHSPEGFLGMMMADMLNEPVDQEALDKFKEALVEKLTAENDGRHSIDYLCSDYGPEGVLLSAAQHAGISPHNFPFKTMVMENRRSKSGPS